MHFSQLKSLKLPTFWSTTPKVLDATVQTKLLFPFLGVINTYVQEVFMFDGSDF